MLHADLKRAAPARSAHETWFDYGVTGLALVALLTGFGTLVGGSDWWMSTLLVAATTGVTCGLLRWLGVRFVALFAIVVELWVLAWIFVPETLIVILPTAQTFSALADLVSAAQRIIVEEQAPVGAAEPIVLVVASSFGLIVIVADAFLASRHAVPLIGGLLLAVFATPALISGETPAVGLFILVATMWLVLLRSRTAGPGAARQGSGPAMLLGGVALVAAVIFPTISPDVSAVATTWGKPPATVFGRGINPMLELGQNLRRNSTIVALTYTTSADDPQYLKVATLSNFSGKTWRPSRPEFTGLDEGTAAVDAYLGIDREQVVTTITIQQLRGSMLPVPYPASTVVNGLEDGWRISKTGLTLRAAADDSRGETYTVASAELLPTAEQMRDLRAAPGPAKSAFLDLPDDMPPVIEQTAREVTKDEDTDYDKVMALQRYFRSGDFRYSETAPVAEDYDGNGVDVIAKFLDVKSGYCVHFSSAMAVMARTLDMPSRIAVGYAPGDSRGFQSGKTKYVNTSDDLHAWTEIYFDGVGWIRFDPTTSVGDPTAFTEPASDPTTDQTPQESRRPDVVEQQGANRLDDGVVAAPEESQTAPRTAIATLAAVIVMGAAPWLVRWARRRWRLNRGRNDVEPLWRELEDAARDLRIPVSAADTPRGFAARLAGQPGVDTASLDALLRRVEQARFARQVDASGDGVAELQAVLVSIRAGATKRQRLVAAVLPRSLTGRAPVLRVPQTGTLAT